jgi:hypothetical protein
MDWAHRKTGMPQVFVPEEAFTAPLDFPRLDPRFHDLPTPSALSHTRLSAHFPNQNSFEDLVRYV